MERFMVVEANELPKRVLDWWIEEAPSSALANLRRRGTLTETVLDEALPRDLYPSQSWASFGMGVPYEQHGVFWYGDPKPADLSFYWQAAARAGRSVGLLGVLHTSPITDQTSEGEYRFVVPDVFGDDPTAVPSNLAPIQELNLRLSRSSARVASLRLGPNDVSGALSMARNGVRPATWAQVGTTAARVASSDWNKERLRVAQSLLLADVFVKAVETHDPDLAVLFINHVASFMHRYWAATFPEDWTDGSGYSDDWVSQNSGELAFAMKALDRIIGRLCVVADRSDRTLLVASSMGQKADLTVDPTVEHQAVLRDPQKFLDAAGVTGPLDVRSAMVPQVTIVLPGASAAASTATALTDFLGADNLSLMSATEGVSRILTVSYRPVCRSGEVFVGGHWRDAADVGMSVEAVTDHRSGRHCPRGVLLSNRTESWPDEIDAFDFAPMILDRLGVPALAHHRSPATA